MADKRQVQPPLVIGIAAHFRHLLLLSLCLAPILTAILGGTAALGQARAQSSGGPVDVAIVLAVDSSVSMDNSEYGLQMVGIANALIHPAIANAIAAGPHKAIAVSMVAWSGELDQTVVLPWTRIAGPGDATRAARTIADSPRIFHHGGTAIGAGLAFSLTLFDSLPWPAGRRVIDVSGDGKNRHAPLIRSLRPDLQRRRITVNGLPISALEPDLETYYREVVISGPRAFVVPALDFQAFGDAFLIKLLREVRGEPFVSRNDGGPRPVDGPFPGTVPSAMVRATIATAAD